MTENNITCIYKTEIQKMQESVDQIKQETIKQDERIKTLFTQQANINKLVESVVTLTQEIKYLKTNVGDIKKEVGEIKEGKIKAYDHYKALVIGCIITGIVSFVLGTVLK